MEQNFDQLKQKIETQLNAKIVEDSLLNGNPIYRLMRESADKIIGKSELENVNFKFYYILDSNINAYTLSIDNFNIICFTTGAMFEIGYTLEKMLHNKHFISHFNNQDESQLLAQISVYFYYFLFYHELAHLAYGHCAFFKNKYALKYMSLFESEDDETRIDRQTLELHADITAARMFRQIISINNELINTEYIIVALVTLFNFLYLFDRTPDFENKIYLPPAARLQTILAIIFSDCLEDERFENTLQKTYTAATEAFLDIFHMANSMKRIKAYQNDIDRHLKLLSENFTCIFEELNRFSFLKMDKDIYE